MVQPQPHIQHTHQEGEGRKYNEGGPLLLPQIQDHHWGHHMLDQKQEDSQWWVDMTLVLEVGSCWMNEEGQKGRSGAEEVGNRS